MEFQIYVDSGTEFSVEVPMGWLQEANSRKPMSVFSFTGEVTVQDEGIPLGALLSVTKFYRQRTDHPGSDAGYGTYLTEVLLPLDVPFSGSTQVFPEDVRKRLASPVKDTQLSGLPARAYRRDFKHYNPFHMARSYEMRLEDVIIQTLR